MKNLVLATCFALPLLFNIPQAQAQNARHNAQVRDMIRSLNGAPIGQSQTRRSYSQRSVTIDPSVQARGLAPQYRDHGGGRYGYQSSSSSSTNAYQYQVDSSCRLSTSEIKFMKNSTALADECSFTYLKDLAAALMDPCLCSERFVIEGHASAEGSYTSNQILSQRRANAIFDYLVRRGVPASRLIAVGHGEAQARFPSASPEYLRAKDRRVMVYKLAH